MRTLCLSLLRTGDIFMHLPVLLDWARENRNAQLELVINDECQSVLSILNEFEFKIHIFPRSELQKMILDTRTHLREPIWSLESWIQKLGEFDHVINLTHTKISGYLAGLIPSPQKTGMVFQNNQWQLFGNQWLHYLNNYFSENRVSQYHYQDILRGILGLQTPSLSFNAGFDQKILLQCMTSDSKKNWPLSQWANVLKILRTQLPDYTIQVLASASEISLLSKYFQPEDLLVVNLYQAANELRKTRLLISGDTSLVHLASFVGTPSLVISLGSSDPIKTGPYHPESAVISGTAECRPCRHSVPCSQTQHVCAQNIDAKNVAHVTLEMLGRAAARVSYLKVQLSSTKGYQLQTIHGGSYGESSRNVFATRAREIGESL